MVKNPMSLQGYGSSFVRMKRTSWPQIQFEVELLPQSYCLVQVEMQFDQKLYMQAKIQYLLAEIQSALFLYIYFLVALCLQRGLYKLHTHEIQEEMNIVQNMEILTAVDLASLSLICHGVSPVMPTLHPLALCHSLWYFPHSIVLFILETL